MLELIEEGRLKSLVNVLQGYTKSSMENEALYYLEDMQEMQRSSRRSVSETLCMVLGERYSYNFYSKCERALDSLIRRGLVSES